MRALATPVPVHAGAAGPDGPARASPESVSAGRAPVLQILVVDDDEADRLTVRRLLTVAGVAATIVECSDADSALQTARQQHFDCVLLDFHLPRHDGLFVLRQLRAAGLTVPVVMLTGQEDVQTAAELMKSGASEYLDKDALDARRLESAVRNALRLHRAEAELRAAQEALRASEAFNRGILEASNDCIKVLDSRGTLLSINDGGVRALGVDHANTIVGTSWLDFWSGEDRTAAEQALTRARAGEPARFIGFHAARNGAPMWWDVLVSPLTTVDGATDRLLAVSRDFTAQKQRQSFEQQLLGIVSHDLRNPLSAITTSAELLLRRDDLDDRTTRSVNRIRSSAERAGRMIRDLLDFTQARLGNGIPIAREPADLAELCQHVVEEVGLAFPGRRLQLSTPESLVGEWDRDRMAQVLTNLTANALQYSAPDSDVTVTLDAVDGHAVLRVHNEGAPIPEETLPRLFEPLQRATSQTDKSARSIGLGLYIVKQLVCAHGGTVEVQSAHDTGTTFVVRLPRA